MTVREMMNKGMISEDDAYQCFPSLDYSPSLAEAEKRIARRIKINEVTESFKDESHYSFPILLPYEERIKYAKLDVGQGIPVLKPAGIDVAFAGQTLSEVILGITPPKKEAIPGDIPEDIPEDIPVLKLWTVQELVDFGLIGEAEAISIFGTLDISVDLHEAETMIGRKLAVDNDVWKAVTEKAVIEARKFMPEDLITIGLGSLILLMFL